MIVDTSAVVAVVRGEPGYQRLLGRLGDSGPHLMAAGTFVELIIVFQEVRSVSQLVEVLDVLGIRVEPVTAPEAFLAGEAYRRFGPGTGHPARLNYGDTFAYALAKDHGAELLFVGDDFGQTDVRVA